MTKYEKAEDEDRLLAKKLNNNKSGANPKHRRGELKKKNSEVKSEDNDNNSENSNSNNTSLISDSIDIDSKKSKTKKQKNKKVKGQNSLNNFINSTNKKKKQENKIENIEDESKNKNIDNEEDSPEKEESENSPFRIPLKERLKKKIIRRGEIPIPLDNLNYGERAKRDISDGDSFSDLNFSDFDKKEKVED